jgi:phage tail protein X
VSAGFLEHRTRDGERWDWLAWIYYGDAHDYGRIVRANPGVPVVPVLPGGILLLIPIVDAAPVAVGGLPPWKR